VKERESFSRFCAGYGAHKDRVIATSEFVSEPAFQVCECADDQEIAGLSRGRGNTRKTIVRPRGKSARHHLLVSAQDVDRKRRGSRESSINPRPAIDTYEYKRRLEAKRCVRAHCDTVMASVVVTRRNDAHARRRVSDDRAKRRGFYQTGLWRLSGPPLE